MWWVCNSVPSTFFVSPSLSSNLFLQISQCLQHYAVVDHQASPSTSHICLSFRPSERSPWCPPLTLKVNPTTIKPKYTLKTPLIAKRQVNQKQKSNNGSKSLKISFLALKDKRNSLVKNHDIQKLCTLSVAEHSELVILSSDYRSSIRYPNLTGSDPENKVVYLNIYGSISPRPD
jgi:hypothetical protein